MSRVYSVAISDVDIYGKSPEIPAGYEEVGFRPPVKGDVFWSTFGTVETLWDWRGDSSSPRLILKKKPKPRKWVLVEDKDGEWIYCKESVYALMSAPFRPMCDDCVRVRIEEAPENG